jgi:hypothetical protein
MGEGKKSLNVFAVAMPEKSQALAGALSRRTNANVIQIAQPQAVHGKAAAANVVGDLVEYVERLRFRVSNTENADAVGCGGTDKANQALVG